MSVGDALAAVEADVRRAFAAPPSEQDALDAGSFEMLDRATALRRSSEKGPAWAVARLSEGLARFLVAREAAAWGNRSYCLQAVEAALDALRDAAAHLPDGNRPSRRAVADLRGRLHHEWRAAQSEDDLGRIAAITLAALLG